MESYDRHIYLLSPKELSPETIAVTFAKTSRSAQSFREIASELSDEKSAQFHEKWVVGYGHASVAEHAILHVAIENVSRLAIETIESNRLASYTEKSTRYQKWDPEAFHIPPELKGHALLPLYRETCGALFDAYKRSLEAVKRLVAQEIPLHPGESEVNWDRRVRSQYVDVCRFLLPASSLANVGLTANARVLEHAIQKMLSSPLQEVREVGEEVRRAARAEVPTLVKYAERQPYLVQVDREMRHATSQVETSEPFAGWCRLVAWDAEGENRILAASLYRYGQADYSACLAHVERLTADARLELAHSLLAGLQEHDQPLREFEHTSYSFDVLMDQGAFFEVKRHRMMTQTFQGLTARLGYAVPRRMAEAGFEGEYRAAMDAAGEAYEKLAAWNPDIAAYVVPNGYNRRVLLTMNLREAYHFCSIRAGKKAHFSVRRVALRIASEIFRRHPALAAFMHLPEGDTWQSIEAESFAACS
jgi:thymidylate synthase ThyX